MDREKARLPSTQEDAQTFKVAKEAFQTHKTQLDIFLKQKADCCTEAVRKALHTISKYNEDCMRSIHGKPHKYFPDLHSTETRTLLADARKTLKAYKSALRPINKEIGDHRAEMDRFRQAVYTFGRLRPRGNTVSSGSPPPPPPATTEKKTFIKPCPSNDCKGFLSTAWKCGLCELWTCPDCHEVKGESRDSDHTCDPDKVATATLLAKEAKGCPKCGVQICKIEGCDQMWCTHCNTGFNWRTGTVAKGPVHNPHYFEWLRSHGQNPTPNQAPPNCDFQTDRLVSVALRAEGFDKEDCRYLREVWYSMRATEAGIGVVRDHEEKFRVLRVRYMADDLSEDDWKIALQRVEKDSYFQNADRQVKDVFVNASRDLVRQILDVDHDIGKIRKQVEELVAYCNASADAVSKRFHRKPTTYIIAVPST